MHFLLWLHGRCSWSSFYWLASLHAGVCNSQLPSGCWLCTALNCRQRPRGHHKISQVGLKLSGKLSVILFNAYHASLEYPNTSKVSLQGADQHSKVAMVFTLTNKENSKPVTVHQVSCRHCPPAIIIRCHGLWDTFSGICKTFVGYARDLLCGHS